MKMNVVDYRDKPWHIQEPIGIKSNTIYRNGTIVSASETPIYSFFKGYGSLNWGSEVAYATSEVIQLKSKVPDDVEVIGKKVYFISKDDYSPLDHGKHGFWARVEWVTQLGGIVLDRIPKFLGGVYTMYIPAMVENVIFENITLVGKSVYGLRAYLGKNFVLNNIRFRDNTYAGISLESTIESEVNEAHGSKGDHAIGAAYGVALVGGCADVTVDGGSYSDYRHGVTVGGTEATSDGIIIHGVKASSCSDAGIDVHPNCDSVIITSNIVDINSRVKDQSGDGICVQNTNSIISLNIIRNAKREGILIQPATVENSMHIVSQNIIKDAFNGIVVDKFSDTQMNVELVNNIIKIKGGHRDCLIQGNNPESGKKHPIIANVNGRHGLILDKRNVTIDCEHNVDGLVQEYKNG